MSELLARLVMSYVDEPLTLSFGDNVACFDYDPASFKAEPVGRALLDLADQLRARFRGAAAPLTFFAWRDAASGALCCTLAAIAPTALALDTPHRLVSDPDELFALSAASAAATPVLAVALAPLR